MNKIKDIQNALKNSECDAMLISGASNRRYATNFRSTAGMVLITESEAWFFIDSRYIEAAENNVKNCEVVLIDSRKDYFKCINEKLNERGMKKLGFEDNIVSVFEYESYKKGLEAELIPAHKMMDSLRAVKCVEELEIMKQAQRISEQAFEQVLGIISTDMTETQLANELVYRMKKLGAEDVSFDPIIVSGAHSSIPHGEAENIKLNKGFLIMDFGVIYKGYCSDTTRTLCIGKPDAEMVKVYNTVLEAQLAGIAAAKAGVQGKAIDKAARDIINKNGYEGCFGHAFSHSLGIDIHENPNCHPGAEAIIPKGAVISAEPGIYIKGKYGVRIEDVLYITENSNEDITNLRKDLIIL